MKEMMMSEKKLFSKLFLYLTSFSVYVYIYVCVFVYISIAITDSLFLSILVRASMSL